MLLCSWPDHSHSGNATAIYIHPQAANAPDAKISSLCGMVKKVLRDKTKVGPGLLTFDPHERDLCIKCQNVLDTRIRDAESNLMSLLKAKTDRDNDRW